MFICFSSQLFVFCEVHGGEEFFSSAKVRFIAKVPITRDINKKKAYTTIQCEFFLFLKHSFYFIFINKNKMLEIVKQSFTHAGQSLTARSTTSAW